MDISAWSNSAQTLKDYQHCLVEDFLVRYILQSLLSIRVRTYLQADPVTESATLHYHISMLAPSNIVRRTHLESVAKSITALPEVQPFLASLSPSVRRGFQPRVREYLSFMCPDLHFTIEPTYLYHPDKPQVCVQAAAAIPQGARISGLRGRTIPITPVQLTDLEQQGKDFSIVTAPRCSTLSLLIGPASFINHDCSPNVELLRESSCSIIAKSLRDIAPGEELTWFYGDHYFGEANCACRCLTCQQRDISPG